MLMMVRFHFFVIHMPFSTLTMIHITDLSLPSTPQREPLQDVSRIENFDINSNTNNIKNIEYKNHINGLFSMHIHKDFQDKRKHCDIAMALTQTDVNLPKSQEESVNNVNSCKVNALNCSDTNQEEVIENSTKIKDDNELPNESVPINISAHNHLSDVNSESNIVPDTSGAPNLENENLACPNIHENVPCSSVEILLDNLKNSSNEDCYNTLNAESSSYSIDSDKITRKSNLDLNIVPNKCGADKENIEEKVVEVLKDEFYFTEEPPDLHVIDDSNVQVEDFHYYDAYDDHENEKLNQEEYDKIICDYTDLAGVREDVTSLTEDITFDGKDRTVNAEEINELSPNFNVEEHKDDFTTVVESETACESFGDKLSNTNNPVKIVYNTNKLTVATTESNLPTANKLVSEINESIITSTVSEELIESNSSRKSDGDSEDEEIVFTEKFDDLNSTASIQKKDYVDSINAENNSKQDEVDNFCNFTTFEGTDCTTVIESCNMTLKEDKPPDFDDFARFDAEFSSDNITHSNYTEKASSKKTKPPDISSDNEEDEFGDFGDYTQCNFADNQTVHSATSTTSAPEINKETILKDVGNIISEMYPPCEVSCDEFILVDVLETDLVFKSVKDVTETNALSYQWTKSAGQEKLLRALNIDTRNIVSL